MATKSAIGIKRQKAEQVIEHKAAAIAKALNIEPLDMNIKGRDPLMVAAMRLEALGEWLAQVALAIMPPNFDIMTLGDLKRFAAEHGIDLEGATKKAEIAELVRAHLEEPE